MNRNEQRLCDGTNKVYIAEITMCMLFLCKLSRYVRFETQYSIRSAVQYLNYLGT